jgi:prepilin-type processing-associated H-X9-DG protein
VFPPGVVNDKGPIVGLPTGYHHGWTVQILPYIGQNNTYHRVNQRESVYAASNATVRGVVISTLMCPSSARPPGHSSYAGCHHDVEAPIAADNHGVLFLNSHIRFDDISDGPAHTIMLGESRELDPAQLGWMSGTSATLRNTGHPLNEPSTTRSLFANAPLLTPEERTAAVLQMSQDGVFPIEFVGGFSSYHPNGSNFLFCDGSARFLIQSINQRILPLLGHRADGEPISDDAY